MGILPVRTRPGISWNEHCGGRERRDRGHRPPRESWIKHGVESVSRPAWLTGLAISGVLHLGLLWLPYQGPQPRGPDGTARELDVRLRLAVLQTGPAHSSARPVDTRDSAPETDGRAGQASEARARSASTDRRVPAERPRPETSPMPEPSFEPEAKKASAALRDPPRAVRPANPAKPTNQPLAEQGAPVPKVARAADRPEPLSGMQFAEAPVPAEPDTARASTASPSQASTQAASSQQRQAYLERLQERIARARFYPRRSRMRGEQGSVTVRFVLARDGSVGGLEVMQSSGIQRLDQAALKTVRRAAPFDPLPEALRRDEWAIEVPLVFRLHD